MVSTRTQQFIKKDREYLFHPFGKIGEEAQIIVERGKGAIFWDTEGKEYIDMSSGGAQCTHLGFARKELIDATYNQMQQISHIFMQAPISCIPAIEYAAELAKVLPGDINHVFFTSTGTESNEIALRAAKFYWHYQGQAQKYKVISLAGAYHGGSHFAASIDGDARLRADFGPEFPGIVRAPSYHCYTCPFGLKYPSCSITCAHYIGRIIEMEGPETICCMIAEPVQGYAGAVWPPDEYWPTVAKILRDHDIILIADCVQTGFCRTGKFWGLDNWNVVPDLLTMGKGINSAYLPLGAVGFSDKVFSTLKGKLFLAGGTNEGGAAVVASGRAALQIYIGEKLAQRSTKLGEHIHQRLVNEFLPLPCVDDVMGKGCYQSFEIALGKTTGSKFNAEAQKKTRDEVFRKLLDKGLFIRIDLDRRVMVTPPLIIGEDELDRALDILLDVAKEVKPV